MDPMTLALLGGSVGAPILGGVLGNIFSSGDQDSARQAQQQALQQMLGVSVPSVDEQKINLGKYSQVGTLTPQMEQAVTMGPSAMSTVSSDPRLKDAQLAALGQLGQLGQGGLNATDKAALISSLRDVSAQSQAQNAAIQQNFQQRGMGGAGAELAARLSASQAGSNQAAQNADNINSMAQQRALSALQSYGSMAGGMRDQDFNQQSAVARAQDAINQFNAMQRQGVNTRNTQTNNMAQQYNLGVAQGIANQNVGLGNQQEMYNKGLYQQNFQNQMQKAGGAANAYNNQANNYNQYANQTRGMWSGIGQGVGGSMSTLGSYNMLGNMMRQKSNNGVSSVDASIGAMPSSDNFSAPQFGSSYGSSGNN
jgi:hypothetical protein